MYSALVVNARTPRLRSRFCIECQSPSLFLARHRIRSDPTLSRRAMSTVHARPRPVDVPKSEIPRGCVDALAASVPALKAASEFVSRPVLDRERVVLDAIRRKSHAQHKSSKHHSMLTRACKRSRDYDALDAMGKLRALRADVEACVDAGRMAYAVDDAVVFPSRAAADECLRALYASCVAAEALGSASEGAVLAFAGQLARGYFMPLSLTATACASRVRVECSNAIEEFVKAYNVVAKVRELLPPPGRFGEADLKRLPPAELRVLALDDGGRAAVAVGDDKVSTDETLDEKWGKVAETRETVAGGVRIDRADGNDLDDLSDLGVRIDRADASKKSDDVVRVMKESQVPKQSTKKHVATIRGGILGGLQPPPMSSFASKKRRRKKEKQLEMATKTDERGEKRKKQKKAKTDAPLTAEDAMARLRQLAAFD
jgi:hypothetical protein